MSYLKEIRKHFDEQKESLFGTIQKGKWRNSENIYNHILPEDNKILNLLPTYRNRLDAYIAHNNSTLKKHIYFHHMNSSQAMCLNFFFPLLQEKKLDVVLDILGFKEEEVHYSKTCFEKKSDIESSIKSYRPTFFDFYIETKSGKKFYFEIKYTENEFGKAKPDQIHLYKFENVYKDKLQVIKHEFHHAELFLRNYQILRNLICISDNSYVVFLYPNGNKKIKSQAESAGLKFLQDKYLKNLLNLTWEHLLDSICPKIEDGDIKLQLNEFRMKYKV